MTTGDIVSQSATDVFGDDAVVVCSCLLYQVITADGQLSVVAEPDGTSTPTQVQAMLEAGIRLAAAKGSGE